MSYYQENDWERESKHSRTDKIMEAKRSFLSSGRKGYQKREVAEPQEEIRRPFGILRLLAAGTLFLLLVSALHFHVSYGGFNRSYIEQIFADNSHWEYLVEQISQAMGYTNK